MSARTGGLWFEKRSTLTQQTTHANTGLTVHCYTKWTLPVEVRYGTVVRRATLSSLCRTHDDGAATGLPVQQQSHRGLRRAA